VHTGQRQTGRVSRKQIQKLLKTKTMGELKKNVHLKGLSGQVNPELVYMQRAGKTFVREASRKTTKQPTAERLAHRAFFKLACRYARNMQLDDGLLALYTAGAGPGLSAYNMALRDFMKPPVVDFINVAAYKGLTGDRLIIEATDDFKVDKIRVAIHTPDGELLEEGDAEYIRSNWVYYASEANSVLTGTRITATAYDLPGHTGAMELIL
jgi:hypothetical protein